MSTSAPKKDLSNLILKFRNSLAQEKWWATEIVGLNLRKGIAQRKEKDRKSCFSFLFFFLAQNSLAQRTLNIWMAGRGYQGSSYITASHPSTSVLHLGSQACLVSSLCDPPSISEIRDSIPQCQQWRENLPMETVGSHRSLLLFCNTYHWKDSH